MAIAHDSSSMKSQDGASSATWPHTCTGTELDLVVGVEVGVGNTILSATYNGVPMTQVNTQSLGGATFDNVYSFNLPGPATGTNNIVVTASGVTFIYCAAGSYTGVDQNNPIDANSTNKATTTSLTGTVTTTVDNAWLAGFFSKGADSEAVDTLTAGANTTIRQTDANKWYAFADTNAAQTPAGSKSMNISTTNRLVGWNIVALRPAGAATTRSDLLLLNIG